MSNSVSPSSVDPWEAAYLRFETPAQEIAKFIERLKRAGADQWPRDSRIVELFCGRGNGLHALTKLGFTNLEGIDLSPRLIAQYSGSAKCVVGDCRKLPFDDKSKDILIVQGGLHHLPTLPGDLEQTLSESRRVLRATGRMVIVEPWLSPFLRFVHAVCDVKLARKMSSKIDALATMIDYERTTYEQWLGQPKQVLGVIEKNFQPQLREIGWGKLLFVGVPRASSP